MKALNCIKKVFRKNQNSIKKQSQRYLKAFDNYAFTEGACVQYKQYRASITKLYHAIEKGLSYEDYRAGFGEKNIEALINAMQQYSEKYDIRQQFYKTALCCLYEYVRKNNEYGAVNKSLELKIKELPGEPDNSGGVISFDTPPDVDNLPFDRFAESRHSIRHFSHESVDIQQIEQALKIAQFTPSACNRQGWQCRVIADKIKIESVLKNQNGNRGFGQEIDKLLLITTDLYCFNKSRELFQPYIDGGMYAMSVLYALHFYGIGCIPLSASLTQQQEKNVREILNIPDNEVPILFIGVGNYPENHVKTTRSQRYEPETQIIS